MPPVCQTQVGFAEVRDVGPLPQDDIPPDRECEPGTLDPYGGLHRRLIAKRDAPPNIAGIEVGLQSVRQPSIFPGAGRQILSETIHALHNDRKGQQHGKIRPLQPGRESTLHTLRACHASVERPTDCCPVEPRLNTSLQSVGHGESHRLAPRASTLH